MLSPQRSTTRSRREQAELSRRELNLPFLIASLILVAVVGGVAFFTQRWQLGRTASSLLERADRLEQDGKLLQAADYVDRFVNIRVGTPEANAARVRVAELFDKGATNPRDQMRAVELCNRALSVATEDKVPTLRRRLGDLLLKLGRYAEAEKEAHTLLKADEGDPAGRRILALSAYGLASADGATGGTGSVGEELERALALMPGDPNLAGVLAQVYRKQPQMLSELQRAGAATQEVREELADGIMNRMVQADLANVEARLARYVYRVTYQRPGAEEDVQAMLAAAPDKLEVLLAAADQARRDGTPESRQQAIGYYQKVIDHVEPDAEVAWISLGEAFLEAGQFEQAVDAWQRGLKRFGKDHLILNQHLANAFTVQGKIDAVPEYLAAMDRAIGQTLGVRKSVQRARQQMGRLARGNWLMKKADLEGHPSYAWQVVGLLQPTVAGPAEQLDDDDVQGRVLLARAYESLSRWDAAATVYEQVARLRPELIATRLAAASAWLNASQHALAAAHCERLLQNQDVPNAWSVLARARFLQQLTVPVKERNWEAFQTAMARAEQAASGGGMTEPWRVTQLKAEYTVLLGGTQKDQAAQARRDAVQLLHQAEESHRDSIPLLRMLVVDFERFGDPAGADRALARLRELSPESAEVYVLQSQLHRRRRQPADAQRVIEEGLAKLPAGSHLRLRQELVAISSAAGNAEQAKQELVKLADSNPPDLEAVFQLAELALTEGNLDETQRREQKLQELEGPAGTYWRYIHGRRLVAASTSGTDSSLREVDDDIKKIQEVRPEWSAGFALKGLLADRRGKTGEAVEAYKRAVQSGDRRPGLIARLVILLADSPEADEYLAMFKDPAAFSPELAAAEIRKALQQGDLANAERLAREEVARRPKDARSHSLLGLVLLNRMEDKSEDAQADPAEAQREFEEAVALTPGNTQMWDNLLRLYAATNQRERALKRLERLESEVALAPAAKAFVLGHCYEMLGERDQADSRYREAVKLDPKNERLRLRVAKFYLTFDRQRAVTELRDALELNPQSESLKRSLAVVTAMQPGEAPWKEALDLLGASGNEEEGRGALRLQAALLSRRRGVENLRQAREIMEKIVLAAPDEVPTDRLELARLYEVEGRDALARDQYRKLVVRDKPNPAHVSEYVAFLLRRELWDEASPWLDRLESTQANRKEKESTLSGLGALHLRSRWLQGKGRANEIEPLVEAFAKGRRDGLSRSQEVRWHAAVGEIYTDVGRPDLAENWARRLFKLAPQAYRLLVMSLALQNRKSDAIKICEEVATTDSTAGPGMVACEALMIGKTQAEDFTVAEPMLAQVLASHGNNVELLMRLANVRFVQGQVEEAIRLYQEVLKLAPQSSVALNNLATTLAEQEGRASEALEYVDRAIELSGPQPELLDTKGTILLYDSRPAEALPLLETATKILKPDPRTFLHKAAALLRTREVAAALQAFEHAREKGLDEQILTAGDRKLVEELEREQRRGSES